MPKERYETTLAWVRSRFPTARLFNYGTHPESYRVYLFTDPLTRRFLSGKALQDVMKLPGQFPRNPYPSPASNIDRAWKVARQFATVHQIEPCDDFKRKEERRERTKEHARRKRLKDALHMDRHTP